jgi:hypothetical protein
MRNFFATVLAATLPLAASAQLFTENFDVDNTANWVVNGGPSDENADFFFDYSTYGIPSAPGSGGTTRGLRMEANVSSGIFGGFSVSPLGQSFVGDYIVRAQVWMNFVGPAPVGGSGSTQLGGLGVGTAGATPQWPGGTQDSVWFATTTDGNSAADWRAYSSAAPTSYPDGNPVYFATTRNASNAYYSGFFPGGTVPAAQTALFPATQTGTSLTGTIAFGWHDSVVVVESGFATWSVDGLPIAQVDLSTVTLGGSNIHFIYSDINTSSTTNTDRLNFMVVDNVVVAVPEPGTMIALGLGAAVLLRRRRRA